MNFLTFSRPVYFLYQVTFNGSFDHMNIDATRYPSGLSENQLVPFLCHFLHTIKSHFHMYLICQKYVVCVSTFHGNCFTFSNEYVDL